jgi:DNA-binding NarL/FixJ family response regulator
MTAENGTQVRHLLEVALALLGRMEAGRSMSLPAAHAQVGQGGRLSPREREVLALVAQGRTNKAIAEALFVSPNTVKTHVTSLLTKLDVDTRAQLAVIATQQAMR